jgi:hypothetical protein
MSCTVSKGTSWMGLVALILAGAAIIADPSFLRATAADRAARLDGLLAVFEHEQSAAEIGRRYLEIAPEEERDLDVLLDLVPAAGADVAETRARLRAQITRDFEDGGVVVVDGWMLARTTVRASAIVALAMAEGIGPS